MGFNIGVFVNFPTGIRVGLTVSLPICNNGTLVDDTVGYTEGSYTGLLVLVIVGVYVGLLIVG